MDGPTRIDVARIKRGAKKLCQCYRPHYEVDEKNRLVECLDCGAIVDPFNALLKVANHYEQINEQQEAMLKERESVVGFEKLGGHHEHQI